MTKNNPTVSVVIPTYNRAMLLPRVIQSVLNQTFKDFELIIVDDSSIDNTQEVIKSFEDERIRYIRHEKNKGGSATRNTGIKVAQGEYIGLLDDDDEWLPEKIEKQVNKFKSLSDEFGVVYSGFSYVSEEKGKIVSNIIPTLRGRLYKSLLKRCIVGSPTPLIKRSCFQKVGFFDETLPSCQDWDMWIRISKCYGFDFVPDVLAKHYVHGAQVSIDLNAKIVARQKLMEKYWVDLSQNSQAHSVLLNRLGILCSLAGDYIKARKYFFASVKKGSFLTGNYIHLFLSMLLPRVHRVILKKYFITNINGIIFYY